MKTLSCLIIASLMFSVGGCGKFWQVKTVKKAPTLWIFLPDESRSNEHLEDAKNKMAPRDQDQFYSKGIIGGLKKDDAICVLAISNRAKESDTIIPPEKVEYNEYNPNVKADYLKKILKKIRSIKYYDVKGTDINGALYRASLVLQDEKYSGYEKTLVIFSDLADTENRPFAPNLNDTKVVVLFFSPDLRPEKPNMAKPDPKAWERRFQAWGAKSVKIVDVDNSFSYEIGK